MYDNGRVRDKTGKTGPGRELWQSLNAAVVLTRNYRADTDPGFQEFLSRLRTARDLDDVVTVLRLYFTETCRVGSSGQLSAACNHAWHRLDGSDQSDARQMQATQQPPTASKRLRHNRPCVCHLPGADSITADRAFGFLDGGSRRALAICSRTSRDNVDRLTSQGQSAP